MGAVHRIGLAVLVPVLLVLAAGCSAGGSDTGAGSDPTTTSEAATFSSTTGQPTSTPTSDPCPAPGELVDLPLVADFSSCAPLEVGEDTDRSSAVVNDAYQVDLAGEEWHTWIDFADSQQAVTVAADLTLPDALASVVPGSLTLICMGPRPSIASVRLGLMRSDAAGLAVLERDDGEGTEGEYLAQEPLDPARLEGTVRVTFTCRATDAGVDLEGKVGDTVVASASFDDGDGYVPFDAVGIRFDHSASDADSVDRFLLDDLSITGDA